jgi:hypothetical protein
MKPFVPMDWSQERIAYLEKVLTDSRTRLEKTDNETSRRFHEKSIRLCEVRIAAIKADDARLRVRRVA